MIFQKTVKRIRDGHAATEQKQLEWRRRPHVIDAAALAALADGSANLRDRAIIWILIESGLRAKELVELNRGTISVDVTGTSGRGYVPPTKSVNGREFLIGRKAVEALGDYLGAERNKDSESALFVQRNGNRITVPQLRNSIRRYCDQLGIERLTLLQFRHNFASRLVASGISLEVLCSLMGHANPTSLVRIVPIDRSQISQEYFRAMETIYASLAV